MSVIKSIKIQSQAGADVVADLGALAENITMSDAADAKTLVQAMADKADSTALPEDFTGATAEAAGTSGLVPAPALGETSKYLKSDGTWGDPAGGVTSVNGETGTVTLDADDVGAIAASLKGANNGVAELDAGGKVPSTQLPSFVDDVLEANDFASLPAEGETGKIYVTLDDNKTYRWSGTTYVEISASLALGETSSTAYAGDKGKAAYDHSQDSGRLTTATAAGLYKVGATAEGHVSTLTAVTKDDITGLGIPAQDTTYSAVSTTAAGLAPQLPEASAAAGKYLDATGAYSVPTDTQYEATTTSVGSASAFTANTPTAFSITGETLVITPGTATALTVTSTTVASGIQEKS